MSLWTACLPMPAVRAWSRGAERGASVGDGVVGAALWLEGRAVVRVAASEVFANLPELTISAWVRPLELSGYREVFRKEDGDRRILFSFQNHGRILSLGLQTEGTGYRECDAPIDPAVVIDGQWHHAAGVYDGNRMTVYLDGLLIGTQGRSGADRLGGRRRRIHRVVGGAQASISRVGSTTCACSKWG